MATPPGSPMPPTTRQGSDAAQTLIRRLREESTSPTVLFYLRLPETILRSTEMGSLLVGLCEELHIPLCFEESFFQRVEEAVSPLKPMPGSFFRVAKTKEGAIDAFRKELHARRAKRPDRKYLYLGATMPLCFQTLRGQSPGAEEYTGSLFFVFSDPENMLNHAVDILREGHFMFNSSIYPVCQIYEMRLRESFLDGHCANNRLAYIILDWELKESEVGDRLTGQQIHQLGEMFPQWFYKQMYDRGHVSKKAKVMAVLKQKTRTLSKGDVKHSFHVVFNVCGVPGHHLVNIIHDCLRDSEAQLRNFKTEGCRDSAFVDAKTERDCIFDHPEIGFDPSNISGNTGMAMFGSRKSPQDPYCALTGMYTFSQGSIHVFPRESGIDNPSEFHPRPVKGNFNHPEHDINRISREQALDLMYLSSCSAPKDLMVTPLIKRDSKDKQARTAIRAPTASSCRGGPPAHGGPGAASSSEEVFPLLPQWFRDFLTSRNQCAGTENAKWGNTYKDQIVKYNIQGADPNGWNVTRYAPDPRTPNSGCPCPFKLSDATRPHIYFHVRNAVILAVNSAFPDALFARCTECSGILCTHAEVERVRSSDGGATSWFKFTEAKFKSLIQKLDENVIKKQHAETIVRGAGKKLKEREKFFEQARSFKRSKV